MVNTLSSASIERIVKRFWTCTYSRTWPKSGKSRNDGWKNTMRFESMTLWADLRPTLMPPLKATVDEVIIEAHSSFFLDSPNKEEVKKKARLPSRRNSANTGPQPAPPSKPQKEELDQAKPRSTQIPRIKGPASALARAPIFSFNPVKNSSLPLPCSSTSHRPNQPPAPIRENQRKSVFKSSSFYPVYLPPSAYH